MVVMVAITRSPLGTKSRVHSLDRLLENTIRGDFCNKASQSTAIYNKKKDTHMEYLHALLLLLLSRSTSGGQFFLKRAKTTCSRLAVGDSRRKIASTCPTGKPRDDLS